MESLRPNEQRAKNAMLLIWLSLAMEVISLISSIFQYLLLKNLQRGDTIGTETLSANDMREQTIGVIYLTIYIVSVVTFIKWFRRAYFNLQLGVENLSHSDSDAASSWFIPVICLFRPLRIMKELYVQTKELLQANGFDAGNSLSTRPLNIWWTFWIINNLIGQFVFRYSLKAETLEELTGLTVASIINNLVGIPLALITVTVIKNYAQVEPLLYETSSKEDVLLEPIVD